MKRWALRLFGAAAALVLAGGAPVLGQAAAPAAAAAGLETIPLGQGLPVMVRTGVYFAEVGELDESGGGPRWSWPIWKESRRTPRPACGSFRTARSS